MWVPVKKRIKVKIKEKVVQAFKLYLKITFNFQTAIHLFPKTLRDNALIW